MKNAKALRHAVAAACLAAASAGANAASLDLTFNYRLTAPHAALGTTIATAHFEDIVGGGIDLVLTNVASNTFGVTPANGVTYISGLLLAFDFDEPQLPSIVAINQTGDTAQSDRWEPQEDVATVDGFTFTSELGAPRLELGCAGCRLGVGESLHVQFFDGDGALPNTLDVADLVAAERTAGAAAGTPDFIAAVKVRGINSIVGGEAIESVQTIVIGAVAPETTPVPLPIPAVLFGSGLAALAGLRRRYA